MMKGKGRKDGREVKVEEGREEKMEDGGSG